MATEGPLLPPVSQGSDRMLPETPASPDILRGPDTVSGGSWSKGFGVQRKGWRRGLGVRSSSELNSG